MNIIKDLYKYLFDPKKVRSNEKRFIDGVQVTEEEWGNYNRVITSTEKSNKMPELTCVAKGIIWSLENEKDQWEFEAYNADNTFSKILNEYWGKLVHSSGVYIVCVKYDNRLERIRSNVDVYPPKPSDDNRSPFWLTYYASGDLAYQKIKETIIKNNYITELTEILEKEKAEKDNLIIMNKLFQEKGCSK